MKRNARVCQRCGIGFQRVRGAPGKFCSRECTDDSRRLYATRREAKAAERKRARDRRDQARRTGGQENPARSPTAERIGPEFLTKPD